MGQCLLQATINDCWHDNSAPKDDDLHEVETISRAAADDTTGIRRFPCAAMEENLADRSSNDSTKRSNSPPPDPARGETSDRRTSLHRGVTHDVSGR